MAGVPPCHRRRDGLGIAHELNQPLTAIANYAQACDRLLAKPGADLEEIRGALQEIAGQAVRAGDIIRRLRGLVRQDEGPNEATDINLLISELTDLVGAEARSHGVEYRLELAHALPRVELHRTQIQQVLLNLTRNAIEALAQKVDGRRTLGLRTALTGGALQISVCDDGPGVSAAIPRSYSIHSAAPKPAVPEWDWQSVVQLLNGTTAH